MNNGYKEHDLDSIAKLLRQHHVVFEVLLQHVASIEATVLTLLVKTLPDKDKADVHKTNDLKKLIDRTLSEITNKIEADLERKLEEY